MSGKIRCLFINIQSNRIVFSTWTYTNARTKPVPKKSFVLFPQFRVGSWSRVYVESFSVCKSREKLAFQLVYSYYYLDKPYICVFVKGSDESLANFIAFFTHTGQLQMKVEYDHRYTLRQLICDESSKGNCICMLLHHSFIEMICLYLFHRGCRSRNALHLQT